ncbi:MAG: DNA topoisomerase III [Clostridiales bacterium]|nr:DNA topoisomerase III [Clostridiales bacterium]
MYLVIAEKPSVARLIANVIGAYKEEDGYLAGNDCIVSWCLGHLAEYENPEYYDEKYKIWRFEDLPIIPEEWRMSVSPDKKKQYGVLKNLLTGSHHQIEYIVNACDAGREGELIFRRVYELSKSRLPVKRLWISSMEDKAILEGFGHLRDSTEYDNLGAASACRAKSDWLVGMNDTRALTTTYGRVLKVGRVMTPTLAMIVEREHAITEFNKEQYYLVHIRRDEFNAISKRYMSKGEADSVVAACNGKDARIAVIKTDPKTEAPPKLYDLTSLQRDANKFFGMTASQTLEAAQRLYESKLVTYPRTDSKYLTEDMEDTVNKVLQIMYEVLPFTRARDYAEIHRIINNKKVSDHHAIIPTTEVENADLTKLSDSDKRLLMLIGTRLLSATDVTHRYILTSALIDCSGYSFVAQGKQIDQVGWKAYEDALKNYFRTGESEEETSEKDISKSFLPEAKEGQLIRSVSSDITAHWTQPPKHFTEGTLLAAMEKAGAKDMSGDVERKGLGTPATRAATIEKLISAKYVVRKGKQLLPTDEGKLLVSLAPEYLKSASMTAEWENRLLEMEHGDADPDTFIDDVTAQIIYLIEELRKVPEEERSKYRSRKSADKEYIGKCPVCDAPVYEGQKSFYCSNKACRFCLWKEDKYLGRMQKKLTRPIAEALLSNGKAHISGLYSRKSGKHFSADLIMSIVDERPRFALDFPDRTKGGNADDR